MKQDKDKGKDKSKDKSKDKDKVKDKEKGKIKVKVKVKETEKANENEIDNVSVKTAVVKNKKSAAKKAPAKEIHVKITTKTHYLADQSSPETQRFLWSYDITIINLSDQVVQLLQRYWKITDMHGKIEEVRGPGVIGLQPLIKPGKEFSYSSYCQLTTAQGSMEGSYEIQDLNEKHFLIAIPKFMLTSPHPTVSALRSRLH